MESLFPELVVPTAPPGFSYYPDFLSAEEEASLIAFCEGAPLHEFTFQGFTAKRRVASFGFDSVVETGTLKKGTPISKECEPLIRKIGKRLSIERSDIVEVLVTEYPPGSVINWHRDAPPFKTIIGVSLLSDCVFQLRPYDEALRSRKSTISLPVARRSLYAMKDAARSDWQHSIKPVLEKRYSITLRTLR